MKKLFALLLCAAVMMCSFGCSDSVKSGKSAEAGEYDGRTTIAYENALVCEGSDTKSISKNRYVATCSFEDSSGDTKIYYPTNYDVITSGEDWSEISENVGLKYKSSFFEENALVVVQIQGCGTTSIEGILCLVAEESTLTPVIQINYVKESAQSEDLVYWYVTAEVYKADIEDCELGELEVEWNIIEAE